MDDSRFDALTRRLRSRRTALTGLLGGVVALLGRGPEATSAKNPAPACKKIKDPKRRRRCLRRARRHKRHKHTCKPQPNAVTCTNRCGPTPNNCKKAVNCPCPVGKTCLANFGCSSRTCSISPPNPCPDGCECGSQEKGGAQSTFYCRPSTIAICDDTPLPCATSATCPQGSFCADLVCDGSGLGRCMPNCPI